MNDGGASDALIAREAKFGGPPPACTLEQRWVLATQALLHERNEASHLRVGGEPRPLCSWLSSYRLRQHWGVRSPSEARERIRWLLEEGHRFGYAEARGRLPREYLGWDLVRASCVAGWSFVAYHLELEEAWAAMLAAARELRESFGSWREVGLSYDAGFRHWGQDAEDDIVALTEALLAPGAAWDLPWELDLSGEVPPPDPGSLPELVVDARGGEGVHGTIRAALRAVDGPKRVIVRAGTYDEVLQLDDATELVAEGEVVVKSSDNAPLIVVGNAYVRGFHFEGGTDADGDTTQAVWLASAYLKLVDCVLRSPRCGVYAPGPRSDLSMERGLIDRIGIHGVLGEKDAHLALIDTRIVSPAEMGVVAEAEVELYAERLRVERPVGSALSLGGQSHSELNGLTIVSPSGNAIDVVGEAVVMAEDLVVEGSARSGVLFATQAKRRSVLRRASITGSAGNDLGLMQGRVHAEDLRLGGGAGCALVVQNDAQITIVGAELRPTTYPTCWLMGASRTLLDRCVIANEGDIAVFVDTGASLQLLDAEVSAAGKCAIVLRGEGETNLAGGRVRGGAGALHLDQGRHASLRGVELLGTGVDAEGAATVVVGSESELCVVGGRIEAAGATALALEKQSTASLSGVELSAPKSAAARLEGAGLRVLGGAIVGRESVALDTASTLRSEGVRLEPGAPSEPLGLALDALAPFTWSLRLEGRAALELELDALGPVFEAVGLDVDRRLVSLLFDLALEGWPHGEALRITIAVPRVELECGELEALRSLAELLRDLLGDPKRVSELAARLRAELGAAGDDDDEPSEEGDEEDDDAPESEGDPGASGGSTTLH